MAQYGGWAGKVLRVNLTTGKISSEDTIAKYKDFVGGVGLGYKVMWDEVPAGTDAFSPDTKVVIASGPICGSGVPEGCRYSVIVQIPGSPFSGVSDGHGGGHFPAELKFAGWDAIIVEGKSPKPVWLCIQDDNVSIRDASKMWGNGITNTTTMICDEMGADAEVIAIGQAGEHLNVNATILTNMGTSSRYGISFGLKNLKAVGVKGTGGVKIAAKPADWKKLLEEHVDYIGSRHGHITPKWPQPWAQYYGGEWTNRAGWYWGAADPPVETGTCDPHDWHTIAFRGPLPEGNVDTDHEHEALLVRGNGCFGCPIACNGCVSYPAMKDKYGLPTRVSNTCNGWSGLNVIYSDVTLDKWQAYEISMAQAGLADDMGIGHAHHLILQDFLYTLQKGIIKANLSEAEFKSYDWAGRAKGDPKFGIDFYRRYATRDGEMANAFADGDWKLQTRWKLPSIQEQWKERPISDMCSNPATWAQFHHHGDWQWGFVQDVMNNRESMMHETCQMPPAGLPTDVWRKLYADIFGSNAVDDPANRTPMSAEKAHLGMQIISRQLLNDSLLNCSSGGGLHIHSPLKERGYKGDITMIAREYSALTGDQKSYDQLIETGVRIAAVKRALNIRFMGTKDLRHKHDQFPDNIFDHPSFTDPAFKPGSKNPNRQDRADLELAKDMIYQEMGWDKDAGVPTRATYEKLGLKDIADQLDKQGLL